MANTGADSMIIDGREFDATNDFMYTKPKVNQSGGKSVGILNSKTKKGLYISTPLMLTWGINEYVDEASGKRTYDMSLQFPKEEYNTEELEAFLKNVKEFESKLKKDAIKNSKEWMNKAKMSDEVVDALWTPMLRYSKNKETGEPDMTKMPTMKVKLPYYDQKFEFELYDNNGDSIFNAQMNENHPSELIPKASNVAIVVQCGGIWFANGKFGVTWRLVQGLVKPRATLKGKCHIQLDADEQTKLERQVVADDEAVTDVPDSDDDEVPAAEPEPAPAPVKKVKKVVKKKSSD